MCGVAETINLFVLRGLFYYRRLRYKWLGNCPFVLGRSLQKGQKIYIGELFSICPWAWNRTHPHDRFQPLTAWKLLAGAAKKRHDICFGRVNATIPPLLLNIPKGKLLNNPTTQSESVSDTGTYTYIASCHECRCAHPEP